MKTYAHLIYGLGVGFFALIVAGLGLAIVSAFRPAGPPAVAPCVQPFPGAYAGQECIHYLGKDYCNGPDPEFNP